jgi:hypothetical protein
MRTVRTSLSAAQLGGSGWSVVGFPKMHFLSQDASLQVQFFLFEGGARAWGPVKGKCYYKLVIILLSLVADSFSIFFLFCLSFLFSLLLLYLLLFTVVHDMVSFHIIQISSYANQSWAQNQGSG